MQAMTWIAQMDKDCVFSFLTPIDVQGVLNLRTKRKLDQRL